MTRREDDEESWTLENDHRELVAELGRMRRALFARHPFPKRPSGNPWVKRPTHPTKMSARNN